MARKKMAATGHHHVYVVYLRNPKGDGRAAYYVGMTGLTPEERFLNHRTASRRRASSENMANAWSRGCTST